jgi:hypothetical protein
VQIARDPKAINPVPPSPVDQRNAPARLHDDLIAAI